MIIATWVVVLGLLTLLFDDQLSQMFNPNTTPEFTTAADGSQTVTLHRNRAGQYIASGFINDHRVNFMVDTGATDVALSAELAEKLGLRREQPVVYRTANGDVRGYRTTLNRVRLGNIVVSNVRGGINPGMPDSIVLLGMSFLKQLELTQRNNTLILKQFP